MLGFLLLVAPWPGIPCRSVNDDDNPRGPNLACKRFLEMTGSEQPPITVLIADDARGIRAVIRLALKQHGAISIVAEAQSGTEAVSLALKHKPDVIVMDYEMPGLNGVDATTKILQILPATKIIMFSANQTQTVIDAAFRAGAVGFLNKDASHELADAVRGVMKGRSYFTG